jgi:hypothetical protein
MNKSILFAKKHKILTIIFVLFISLAIFSAIKLYVEAPRDLGNRLEYIGKSNASCEWWELPLYFGFCAGPSYEYYFATDMGIEELKGYFRKAKFVQHDNLGGASSSKWRAEYIPFELNDNSDRGFTFLLYNDAHIIVEEESLQQTTKPYVISIHEDSYPLAQSAL